MQIKFLNETKIIDSNGWLARVRPPDLPWNGRVVLLLHGWTGDENIMWIFARRIPPNCWMIAPRAPLESPEGGYAWAVPVEGSRPDITQFLKNSKELSKQITNWVPNFSINTRMDIVGFSQGAAMAYTLCLETNPIKIAPLAGYLPPGFEQHLGSHSFSGIEVFIAHNTDDKVVTLDESKSAAALFEKRGAKINFCEGTGGHKLNSSCFKGLDNFLKD